MCHNESSKADEAPAKPAVEEEAAAIASEPEAARTEQPGSPVLEKGAPTVEELLAALEEAQRQLAEQRNELLRARAELENVLKRSSREVANAHKFALERFASDLLPVKDSLDLGRTASDQTPDIAALREGMELTLKILDATLERHGVMSIEPLGERFNPELHQAMSVQESGESAPGTVLAVMQKGFMLNERLLRPAMVIVAKGPQEKSGGP